MNPDVYKELGIGKNIRVIVNAIQEEESKKIKYAHVVPLEILSD